MVDNIELVNVVYKRTLEAIKIKSLKIYNAKNVCQWPRCVHFSANNMHEALGSRTSNNNVNKELDQAKR